jgi:hypothetical protein
MTKTPLPLEKIVGEQLSSVEFVRDYVQLRFDGPTLTAFVLPTLKSPDRTIRFGDQGYRDELCARISHHVSAAYLREGDAVIVEFDDGTEIRISLKPEDRVGPEAGHFTASADPHSPLLDF